MPSVVKMPKWGLTMKSGRVTDWHRQEGAAVAEGDPLLTVETDKAVNDVPAPASGVLRKIVATIGDEVPVSDPVAIITAPDEALSDDDLAALLAASAQAAATSPGASGAARATREARTAARDESGRVNASPAARKRAQELGLDLAAVPATGPGGRITSDDVERAAAGIVREEYATLPDGRRLFAVLTGPPGTAPPLVFLHGLGGSYSTWQAVLPGFAERHRLCALDLPGHGASDKPDPASTDYSPAGLAEAVAATLAVLRLSPVVIIGHSLGGLIGLHLALAHPDLVDRLVLVDSAGLGEEVNLALLDRIAAPPTRDDARHLLELFFHDPRYVLDAGVDDLARQRADPAGRAAVLAAAAAGFDRAGQRDTGVAARLGEVTVPTLIVWGVEDQVFPASQAQAAASHLPNAQVEVIAGAGHVPPVEAADRFVVAVEQFLASGVKGS